MATACIQPCHPPPGFQAFLLQCNGLFHHGEASLLETEQTLNASLAFPGADPTITSFTNSPVFPSPGMSSPLPLESLPIFPQQQAVPVLEHPKVRMFISAGPGAPWRERGRHEAGGPCLTRGIRDLLTGFVGTDPQLLSAKLCPEVPWVWQAEQRVSIQARERRPFKCWSNPKAALLPWEWAGSAHLHALCIALHIEIRCSY